MNRLSKLLIVSATALLVASCAGNPPNPDDPYEGYNRNVYAFNTAFDKAISRPVAEGYTHVVPKLARQGIGNAFHNLGDTRTAVIDVTQGRFDWAIESVHRFVFNSTFGLLGVFDLTDAFGLPKKRTNDFGTTLAKMGWKNSNYFVIPFMGPSTSRDGVGIVGDAFATPYVYVANKYVSAGLTVASLVHLRSELLDVDSASKKVALDEYVFQREAYMQYRNNVLKERGVNFDNVRNRQRTDDANYDGDEEEMSLAELARSRNSDTPAPQSNQQSSNQDDDDNDDELSLSELARKRHAQ